MSTDAGADAEHELFQSCEEFDPHRILLDVESGEYWCGICTDHTRAVALIGKTLNDVRTHVAERQHMELIEQQLLGIEEFCPIELNGKKVLLDHHVIYPSVMFGEGSLLFDETVGMLLTLDVCGGVKIWPQHKYTVTRFVLPESAVQLPSAHSEANHGEKNGSKEEDAELFTSASRSNKALKRMRPHACPKTRQQYRHWTESVENCVRGDVSVHNRRVREFARHSI